MRAATVSSPASASSNSELSNPVYAEGASLLCAQGAVSAALVSQNYEALADAASALCLESSALYSKLKGLAAVQKAKLAARRPTVAPRKESALGS